MAAPAIVVDDVAKSFGEVEALRGVSFEVPVGSVLGVLGPNGSGKTTAVRILTTLLRPDRGRVEVLGIDVVAQPARARAVIGLAGQSAAIDANLTGRENLQLVGRLTHMSKARVAARSDELLEGFDLVGASDRLVRTYSGGMRRRLDLAAALVHEPPVLFLDEPTTGLDPRSRNDLWGVIERLVAGGATVLLTTQYLEEADRLADNMVVFDHGTVIAEGTASELKATLGATVIELKFATSDEAAQAAERVAAFGAATVSGVDVHLSATDSTRAMLDTVRELDERGPRPTAMALREPTLDDVFLSITGHGAEEATDGENDDQTRAGTRRTRRSQ